MTMPLKASALASTRQPASVTGAVPPPMGSELIMSGSPWPAVLRKTPSPVADQCSGLTML